jgi:Putative DNA-binding domain
MASLRKLQLDMQSYLLGADNRIADAIVDAPPLPPGERLAIYRNGYRVRLLDALDATYPILHAVLGDDDFVAAGEAFIASLPSVHRSIRWYGSELPQFLADSAPYSDQPIFAELAQLEWTLSEVFDSADVPSVTRADLAGVDPMAWSGLTLEFHPSLRRLQFEWNTVAVWQDMSRGEMPANPTPSERPVPWLLWRQDLQNYFRSLTPDEEAALGAAHDGCTFGDMCEVLAEWLPQEEIPLRAATLFGVWADSGILTAINQP